MTRIARILVAATMFFCTQLTIAAEPPSTATLEEIRQLLGVLEKSGCSFYRNGDWYDAKKAKDHLTKKYNYLLKKGMIGSTEDFIRLGATASSSSGEAYRVRCVPDESLASAAWLSKQLSRLRGDASNPKPSTPR